MSFERISSVELERLRPPLDRRGPADADDDDYRVSTSRAPVELRGLEARRQRPVRIVARFVPRWLLTVAVVWAIFGVLLHYASKPVMSKDSERRFNALITGLSIALGLAITSSLDAMVGDLRWRVLSRRYRSRHKVERILQADSMVHLVRLAFRTRRPSIHVAVLLWILLLLGSQVAVASLGLCYSTNTAEKQTLMVPGEILIADLSTVQTSSVVSSKSASLSAQQYVANSYGIVSTAYLAGGMEDVPIAGNIYVPGDPLLFCGDSCLYAFRETSLASFSADGTNSLAVISSRTISASTACVGWPVKEGGEGNRAKITVAMEQGDVEVDLPHRGGSGQTTYMINTTQSCGPGCSPISAFEASSTSPWYFRCNITVGPVANASRPEHEASLDVRTLASAAVALQGYDVSSLANDSTLQFQSYPAESIYGSSSEGNADSLAFLLSRFAIGVVAGVAEGNMERTIQGTAPERGDHLKITHPEYVFLILFGVICAQLVLEVGIALWAHQVVVPPSGSFAEAQILQSMMRKPRRPGSTSRPGAESPDDQPGEPLWAYRAAPTATDGVYDLYMEKSYVQHTK